MFTEISPNPKIGVERVQFPRKPMEPIWRYTCIRQSTREVQRTKGSKLRWGQPKPLCFNITFFSLRAPVAEMKLGNPNYIWQLIEARIEFDIKILRNTVMNKKLQLSFKRSCLRDWCLPMCNNLWQRCDLKALGLPIIIQRWPYAIPGAFVKLDRTNRSFHLCHLFGGPLNITKVLPAHIYIVARPHLHW